MMKILAIDPNAVLKTYRQSYAELSKFSDGHITVIAPKYLDLQFKRFEQGK